MNIQRYHFYDALCSISTDEACHRGKVRLADTRKERGEILVVLRDEIVRNFTARGMESAHSNAIAEM